MNNDNNIKLAFRKADLASPISQDLKSTGTNYGPSVDDRKESMLIGSIWAVSPGRSGGETNHYGSSEDGSHRNYEAYLVQQPLHRKKGSVTPSNALMDDQKENLSSLNSSLNMLAIEKTASQNMNLWIKFTNLLQILSQGIQIALFINLARFSDQDIGGCSFHKALTIIIACIVGCGILFGLISLWINLLKCGKAGDIILIVGGFLLLLHLAFGGYFIAMESDSRIGLCTSYDSGFSQSYTLLASTTLLALGVQIINLVLMWNVLLKRKLISQLEDQELKKQLLLSQVARDLSLG